MASFCLLGFVLFLLFFSLFVASPHSLRFEISRIKIEENGFIYDPSRVAQLSWNPRAFLYKGFLSDMECDYLISLAKNKLKRSMVANSHSGAAMFNEARTSSGYFLRKHQES